VATEIGAAGVTVGSAVSFDRAAGLMFETARNEIVIDRPADQVWAVWTDQRMETVTRLWPAIVGWERVAGEEGQAGEVILVTKTEDEGPPTTMRTVRVIPNRLRVLRIDAVDGSFTGFVDHSLYEEDGRTRVVYNGFIETRGVSPEEMDAFDYERQDAAHMEYLDKCNELLRELVEERWPAPGS
jgi:hypothetical protein